MANIPYFCNKKRMKHLIILFTVVAFFACNKSKNTTENNLKTIKKVHPGKKLMQTKCYVCHNPSANGESRIAPPMIAVKNHYLSTDTTKEEFVNSMQNWIKNPVTENIKMPGAVKKFGMMPKQYFSEKTIELIAEYMYENELEKPVEFDKDQKNRNLQNDQGNLNNNSLSNQEKGLQIALATKAVLGKNLMRKIQKEGNLAALDFCHVKAIPLTDSMSIAKNATIKRASDKPRNPKNKASLAEEEYIQIFKNNIQNNKDSDPIVVENGNKVNVYYPITTNSMCLQCHGTPKTQVKETVLAGINKKYPNDKAVGYNINEVRGIWNVQFQNNK